MKVYLYVVKSPPTEEKGCADCQFHSRNCCDINGQWWGGSSTFGEVPDWCPLTSVDVPKEEGK